MTHFALKLIVALGVMGLARAFDMASSRFLRAKPRLAFDDETNKPDGGILYSQPENIAVPKNDGSKEEAKVTLGAAVLAGLTVLGLDLAFIDFTVHVRA